ncbi:MAG: hypothetical protein HKN74_04115, partial [Acidimicrobiia bacterium]|nr:hypothetical protein [Acidimicrobiia bacterium]
MAEQLEFKALGPLEVSVNGDRLDLGPHKQRSLLALLLANVNQVVSIDRIVEALWGDSTDDKEKTVWVYVSRLRSALEPHRTSRGESSVLLTKEPGYVLAAEPSQVDYLRFEEAVATARAALSNDAARARDLLDDALGL